MVERAKSTNEPAPYLSRHPSGPRPPSFLHREVAMRVHIRFYSPLLRQSQSVFQQPLAEREAVLPPGTYVLEGNVDTQARAVGLGARPLCTGCISNRWLGASSKYQDRMGGLGETDGEE